MIDGVSVRSATQADGDQMAVFMSALSAEAPDTISRRTAPTANEERAFVRRAENAEQGFILLALHTDKVIGLLDLWRGRTTETRHSAHFGMSVVKAWRNQGVGRCLLEVAIARALTWEGFCRLELEVTVWNAPAIQLYEKLGFNVEGQKIKSLNIRGIPESSLLMARTW